MYEAHFQMHHRPFPPSADVSSYVALGPVEQAGQTLLRVVGRGSGPALVVGSAGTGKSMVCQLLAEHFGQQMHVALLANGQLANPRAFLQAVLFELGLPYREMDENELRLALVDFLTDAKRCPQGLLLIVDEAHSLPLRILEEIRMLTNVTGNGQSRVQLILAGGAALEEKFTSPKLDSFNQRIAARCYLESLNREETSAYIQEQVTAAGGDGPATFTGDGVQAVYDATDGIPRLVNQVCDHALIMAAVGGHTSVTGDIVQEAWADLQQLPTPWLDTTSAAKSAAGEQHVIEFGALDDESDSAPASIPFSALPDADEPAAEVSHEREDMDFTQPQAETQLDDIDQHISAVRKSLEGQSNRAEPEPDVAPEPEPETIEPPAVALNPFEESFDEEEVLVDSYAALQENRFTNAPRVASREGREIAALLAEVDAQFATAPEDSNDAVNEAFVPTVPVTEDDQELPEPNPDEDDHIAIANVYDANDMVETQSADSGESNLADDVEPDDVEQSAQRRQEELTQAVAALLNTTDDRDAAMEEEVLVNIEQPSQPSAPLSIVDRLELPPPDDDRDLIIVEQQSESTTPHIEQGKARRRKYRQLFNRLRQA